MSLIKEGAFAHFDCGDDCDEARRKNAMSDDNGDAVDAVRQRSERDQQQSTAADDVMALVEDYPSGVDDAAEMKRWRAAVRAAVERVIRQTRTKTLLEALDTENYAELRMLWQRARDAALEEALERQRGGAG